MNKIFFLLLSFVGVLSNQSLKAQEDRTNKKGGGYHFKVVKEYKASAVKNQNQSSTCWCFSTESFLENEIERLGKGIVDLSEMYIVRMTYEHKAWNYVRMQGKTQFAPGGEPHDVLNTLRIHGIMPQNAYPGKQEKIIHHEVDAVLKAYLDEVIKLHNGKLSDSWFDGFKGILDGYFGRVPETFLHQGKNYTSKEFAKYIGINPDDYIELTSFNHHAFYKPFILEVPDNWSWGMMQNITLNELEEVADNALNNGYTVEWASDVSEKGFSYKNGLAIVPARDWAEMKQDEKDSLFAKPYPERDISQDIRQQAFDNQSTQDDHGMQLTGIVKDQVGTKYYIVKNSWGTDNNDCSGYFYCSSAYYRYKTTGIMVHKNAVPKHILKKLDH
ncbi:MAG: aminopeptidase [Flavobacteriaceae bacterium]|nr:aminopeptidase [Flavobacteriaceae bacterium]